MTRLEPTGWTSTDGRYTDRRADDPTTLIGGRLDVRVMTWLIVVVLIVMPLEAIGYDDRVVTATLPVRAGLLAVLLVMLRRELIGPIRAGRLFLALGVVMMFGAAVLVDTEPGRTAIEGVAYGTILPIFTMLIAPKSARRWWALVVSAVVVVAAAVRLVPDHATVFTQVLAVLTVHGAALALLDLHADRAELVGEMAGVDALTGLWNRRETVARISASIERAGEGAVPSSIVLLDLDHFKAVNDSLGHEAGDDVLRSVASVLATELRPGDAASRWGGEEFLVHLPDTDRRTACALAEEMRVAITTTGTTASFGVAEVAIDDTATTWVRRADLAMYRAKAAGRDRVVPSS